MEFEIVDSTKFKNLITKPNHIYNGADFIELNSNKVEEVLFMIFKENGKAVMGLTGGIKDGIFSVPFSAPFGGFCNLQKNIHTPYYDEALVYLEDHFRRCGIERSRFVLPPQIYEKQNIASQLNSMHRAGYKITTVDLNYHIPVSISFEEYINSLDRNGRRNLVVAEETGLEFTKAEDDEAKLLAYEVIHINRQQHNYPLKLTYENVLDTSKIIPIEFFNVHHPQWEKPIASAVVYTVTPEIAQVVYWGHLEETSSNRPINFLAKCLFEYYHSRNMRYLDIGPSTDRGTPTLLCMSFLRLANS